jgi:hypothetical protein
MKKSTFQLFSLLLIVAFLAAFLSVPTPAPAADLTYSTPLQTGDSELEISHKHAAAVVNGNSYANITSSTTTVVKSGSGVLDRIVVNTAGSTHVLTIYDNTAGSGTKIGTASANAQGTLHFNVRFATGLTIVSSGGTPADVTVSYR